MQIDLVLQNAIRSRLVYALDMDFRHLVEFSVSGTEEDYARALMYLDGSLRETARLVCLATKQMDERRFGGTVKMEKQFSPPIRVVSGDGGFEKTYEVLP